MVTNPPPKSMPAVAWDYEIESLAQGHAEKCTGGHSDKSYRQYPVKCNIKQCLNLIQ